MTPINSPSLQDLELTRNAPRERVFDAMDCDGALFGLNMVKRGLSRCDGRNLEMNCRQLNQL